MRGKSGAARELCPATSPRLTFFFAASSFSLRRSSDEAVVCRVG